MKRILSAVGLMGIIFTSCNTGSSSDVAAIDSSVVPKTSATTLADTQPQTVTGPITPQQNGLPVTLNGSASNTVLPAGTVPVTAPQVTATSTTTAPGMNPPHGQPGHRCDINVGAPLNSKPNPTTTPTQPPVQATITQPNQPTTTQPIQTSISQPAATTTAPGMNPPHGQPNHRCDIAVGAPLNSKPAAAPAITQTPVQQPAQSPNVTPAGTTTFTAPGMNPPHGQPNHRCDIAVGAPLNSAPVKKDTVAHN
ncbi:MAG TPA: hypothetical protein VK484_10280 [Ferruginibacter sp.]|nr:hypothetical protein [Ferruginibacter sp.]